MVFMALTKGSASLLNTATAVLLLSAAVSAQVGQILDHSKLPSCAFNCQLLTQAQSLCVPPTAPEQGQAVYQTCFCNSNYLVNYKAGASTGVCDNECPSASDRDQIMQWYKGLCNGGAVVTPNNGGSGQATSTNSGSSSTSSSSSSKSGSSVKNNHPSWIEQHYRWIIMLIVIFLAAVTGTILGVWLKRRHKRRHLGHSRDSVLAAEDATKALQNRHPGAESSVSQVQIPTWDGSVLMSGANSKEMLQSRSVDNITPAPRSKGKTRVDSSVKEMGVAAGPVSPISPDEDITLARSNSKLKKKSSKRSGR